MPELPEVETVRRQLAERVTGRTIAAIDVRDDKFCSPATPAELAVGVVGRRIAAVGRRGKYLLLRLDSGDDFVVHLRMTGRLHWSAADSDPDERFVRAVIALDDGGTLTFSDMRRFGRGWIVPGAPDPESYWAGRVGAEPLDPAFTVAVLADLLRGRRGPIKAVLLNQSLVAGLGNIYADEALFAAGVHPERTAGGLSPDEVARLHDAIVDRLRVAVEAGGSSIDSYRDSLGNYGSMQDRLRVHLHRGDPCPRCGDIVVKTRVAQRGTYWCPTCQVT
jgi:formamidopyrimidine-DNA glycosylase